MSTDDEIVACVANIPVHWNADGSVKRYLLDREDSELVVKRLREAGFLK